MALDKLVDSTQLDGALTATANAIRAKGGTSASIAWDETNGFKSAIEDLPTGGGSAVVVTEEPDTNGGTKKIITAVELTGDTVTAEHLEVGYTAHNASGQAITGTMPASSGPISRSDVNFYDYDGTLVASKTKTEINAMTSDSDLPANPTHTGLTAQGWNWTVAQLKAQLTAMPDQPVDVGQMYITASGATEIDVIMPEGRLSPIMTICVNGEVSIDWGDETTPSTVTGTSLTTMLDAPHTYASAGSYTIKISSVSGTYSFNCSDSYTLLRKNTTASQNRVYTSCIQHIRLGSDISIGSSAFNNCYSLACITIPSSVTSIGSSAFNSCYSLASITIPSSVTSIGSSAFSNCYSLASITIPSGVTSIKSSTFQNCNSLASVTIPSDVTSINSSAFSSCLSLASIIIPSDVTSIGSSAFSNCFSLASITIPSSVTSIGNSVLSGCYSLASIIIPSDVTSIGSSAFNNCYSLACITIPSSVMSIGSSAFSSCYGMAEYHFKSTNPPTLSNTNAFTSIPSDCIIYVPRSENQTVLNAYKTASIWSNYASYMREEPAP